MASGGAITEEDKKFTETWENISQAWNSIIRLDRRGDEYQEVIMTPRKFMVTTEERKITQDRILESKNDPFLNGCFRPVIVPDSVTIQSNPNALSDDEMISVMVSSELAFDEWMKVIDSPSTLERMLEVAEKADAEISLKRYQRVKGRIDEVKPKARVTQKDVEQYEKIMSPDTRTPSRKS